MYCAVDIMCDGRAKRGRGKAGNARGSFVKKFSYGLPYNVRDYASGR